ncbi:MAG: hypothetical protein KAG84_08505 [Bacteroidales bacterium]|nr:hypothetical protein [Bacteroidales bacterium]
MRHITLLFSIFFLLFSINSLAQKSIRDSSIFIPSLSFNYGIHTPISGIISDTYGYNHAVGGDLNFKLKTNISVGLGFEYMFSDNVINEDAYFKNIKNTNGYVIDGNGQFAEVFLYERGYNIQLFAGYQLDVLSPNPNSGPYVQLGIGFMQYHTRIENKDLSANAVIDDYAEMYDRLRNGFSSTQVLGYRLMGNRNLANFFIAVEFTEAWTNNRRNYNADLDESQQGKSMDLLIGVKVGWLIPFYGRAPKEYYYY